MDEDWAVLMSFLPERWRELASETGARKADFTAALPHLGTKLVAYHANENFVCREYGFLGAVVVVAELWANTGIVCDDTRRQPDHTRRIAATTRPMMLILSILRSQAS